MEAASRMPPLVHWPDDGSGFHIERSKVCDWLVAQPEIRQEVFNWCKRHGVITYDTETRTWRGIAYLTVHSP
jgi:hypothetical protein